MPQEMNLNSFIVLSHPGLKMCVSTQSRSHLILIQVSRFASHLPQVHWFMPPFHPCGFSPQSRSLCLCLISIHVTSHLNPGRQNCIPTTPSRIQDMCLTSIHALSHLDAGPKTLVSPPYMYCLNPIQVHIVTSHLPPDSVSTPSRSWYSCVTSIQVTSHLHPGLEMYGTPLSMPCLTSNHAIHQGCGSPQPISWYLHVTTIQVMYHLHQVPEICISAPSRSYLKAIQVSRCVSHIHSGPVSDLSELRNSCLTSIQVPPSLHPSPYIHISPPSRC